MVAALTLVINSVLFTIAAMNYLFAGVVRAPPDAFESLLRAFGHLYFSPPCWWHRCQTMMKAPPGESSNDHSALARGNLASASTSRRYASPHNASYVRSASSGRTLAFRGRSP